MSSTEEIFVVMVFFNETSNKTHLRLIHFTEMAYFSYKLKVFIINSSKPFFCDLLRAAFTFCGVVFNNSVSLSFPLITSGLSNVIYGKLNQKPRIMSSSSSLSCLRHPFTQTFDIFFEQLLRLDRVEKNMASSQIL